MVYRDWLFTEGGGVAPDLTLAMTAPESVVLAPTALMH